MELTASPVIDAQTLDLSRLSSTTGSSQRINPGDQLKVTVVTGAEEVAPEAWPVRVGDDGTAQLPLIGQVHLAGHDVATAQTVITRASMERGIFRQPSIAVTVDDRRTSRVTVLGAIDKPGEYEMDTTNCDLLTAIGLAGGMTEAADTVIEVSQPPIARAGSTPQGTAPGNMPADPSQNVANVAYLAPQDPNASGQLLTGGPVRGRIDLVQATQSPPPSGIPLRDGSVVVVRKRPPRYVHVMGLVKHPNQFELPANQNIRVLDALALAGGRTYTLADRVYVVRQVAHSEKPALIEVSVREAKENSKANILLASGDVVSVEDTPTTLVLGALNQFVRFGLNGSVRLF